MGCNTFASKQSNDTILSLAHGNTRHKCTMIEAILRATSSKIESMPSVDSAVAEQLEPLNTMKRRGINGHTPVNCAIVEVLTVSPY